MIEFAVALVITVALEIPVIWFLLRDEYDFMQLASFIFAVNLVTLSVLWFILPNYFPYLEALVIGEVLAVFIESVFYSYMLALHFGRAFWISFAANVWSFLIGVILIWPFFNLLPAILL
ncbi:hypothetical protein JXB01_03515 [Candidatus Micrarchaeota archaeon]|nr:hypothetical protein [Candidatus Micrarchaeota archaeon]